MFHVFENPIDSDKLPEWLAFAQSDSYEPFSGNWTRIYHQGSNTIETPYGELKQFIRALPALVNLDDIDAIRNEDPYGSTGELEFTGGGRVGTSATGYRWDSGMTQTLGSVELARFLTSFRYNRPQLDPGFIGYHDLIDEERGDYATYHTNDPVVQFSGDEWEEDLFGESPPTVENIQWMNIQTSYLLDYLDVRNAALVIGYFESREVHHSSSLNVDAEDKIPVNVFDGPAVRSLKHVPASSPYLLGELHWFCPILPTSRDASVSRRLEENKQIEFVSGDGNEVSVADLETQSSTVPMDWVYFEMDVLEKYIDSPEGTVEWITTEMGTIEYQDLTVTSIFRNDEHEVVLFVDDLEKLPRHELPHWKVHNRAPVGQLPNDAYKTQILAEFVDQDDHPSYSTRVLDALDELNKTFEDIHGTPLVDDLDPGDEVEPVIMPARNDQDQLVDSMVALNKILFERMEAHLEDIKDFLPEERADSVNGTKSALYELSVYLFDEDEAKELLKPLNAVYGLRQHGSHRGTSKWRSAIEAAGLQRPVRDYRDAYVQIMTQTAESLEAIEAELFQK
jgi:hypothetical protein